jgi:hypothetical protein
MADGTVRRILHFKFTLPTGDASPVITMIKMAQPFMAAWGGKSSRLLQSADDPTRFIHEIEYEAPESLELNRQQIASDPRVQAYLASWRMLSSGAVDVEVFKEAG